MARYDKDNDRPLNTPSTQENIDKPKGQMSIRDAAAREMPTQHLETGRHAKMAHGFGNGAETAKRHTEMGVDMMNLGMEEPSTGASMTELIERIFQLPFQAQVSVTRMVALRVLGAMDARDQQSFMNDLRSELGKVSGEDSTEVRPTSTEDIQGT
ncbi:hypothetical protein [Vitiosangium sp. GDMCC 1.1324]|uniref:hypothetical protein n=1 Tax=Vitiosangium sp. (strain GDMCC 1.1324) TaxID=2138576 RepID=UPI000D353AAE|nr:hypothetical protein [Vitiosangium sp. GDMCC 1.1324]PTL79311.1 hypothetical protein DAT35_34485 [Vitiosangium sp. GDMCC 1.1324]